MHAKPDHHDDFSSARNSRIFPRPTVEGMLQVWKDVFRFEEIECNSNFFDLGGNSLLAGKLQAELKKEFGVVIRTADILDNVTVVELAAKMESIIGNSRREEVLTSSENVIALQPRGEGRPLFVVSQSLIFRNLALQLGTRQPTYSIRMNEGDPVSNLSSLDEILDFHLQWIRTVQPSGPYRLAGWCVSGWIAYGIARKLEMQGETIELLAVIDTVAPGYWSQCKWSTKLIYTWHRFDTARRAASTIQLILRKLMRIADPEEAEHAAELEESASQARFLGPLEGNLLLFCSEDDPISCLPNGLGWERIIGRPVHAIPLPGNHHKILENPGAGIMASEIRNQLDGMFPSETYDRVNATAQKKRLQR